MPGAGWTLGGPLAPAPKRPHGIIARSALQPDDIRMATHRIAVIPGDGIGKEVVPEGLRVLEAEVPHPFLWVRER